MNVALRWSGSDDNNYVEIALILDFDADSCPGYRIATGKRLGGGSVTVTYVTGFMYEPKPYLLYGVREGSYYSNWSVRPLFAGANSLTWLPSVAGLNFECTRFGIVFNAAGSNNSYEYMLLDALYHT